MCVKLRLFVFLAAILAAVILIIPRTAKPQTDSVEIIEKSLQARCRQAALRAAQVQQNFNLENLHMDYLETCRLFSIQPVAFDTGTKRNTAEDNRHSEFLQETEYLDFRHSLFTTTLRRITSENMSVEQKLEALFYFVRDSILFNPSASGQKASDYLFQNKAICYHKAMIFVCFCRLLGIPARVAEEHFVIRENPKYPGHPNAHGIANIFFNNRWIYVDTVSNREAWRWWVTKGAESFEPPKFTLEKNVIVDSAFISSITFKDVETNNVPRHWLD